MKNETTFGNTPAARYLVRELSRTTNEMKRKMVGRRITNTSTAVTDLIGGYESGVLKPKTVANCLRLMREEIASEFAIDIVDQLRQNVQIGIIKRGIRLCSVARKSERSLSSKYKTFQQEVIEMGEKMIAYKFKDSNTGNVYTSGIQYGNAPVIPLTLTSDEVDTDIIERLNQKSDIRYLRRNKNV